MYWYPAGARPDDQNRINSEAIMEKEALQNLAVHMAVLAALTGSTQAAPIHWSQLVGLDSPFDASSRALLTIDVSGMASWDFQGDPDNDIVSLAIGGAIPIGIEWDLYITTVGVSWAEEVTLGIADESLTINPAFGDAFSVIIMNYQGSLFGGFSGSPDGVLEIELYEVGFDDNPNGIDAFFESGSTITVLFPSPGTLGPILFSGLIVSRRRRLPV